MRIILFGEDSFTAIVLQSLIDSKHEVVKVYCPLYDNKIHKRLQLVAEKNNIEFIQVNDVKSVEFIHELASLGPDVIAICHFQKLIAKEIINIPKFGCLNLHPSLLPHYRGMAPQHWPIINGDLFTGITVHFIDEGVDTGNIIIQKRMEILPNEYVSDLQSRMKSVYSTVYVEALEKIADTSSHIEQKHLKGSYYGRLKVKDCIIDESFNINQAYNLIRGVSFPYYGARFGQYILWTAEIFNYDANDELGFLAYNEKEAILKLNDGTLKITRFNKL